MFWEEEVADLLGACLGRLGRMSVRVLLHDPVRSEVSGRYLRKELLRRYGMGLTCASFRSFMGMPIVDVSLPIVAVRGQEMSRRRA